jgi:KaiC/GvpD/RAD55 family RecA-like ATPase
VIDGIGNLATTVDDPLRVRDHPFALTQQLTMENVASMFTIQDTRTSSNLETLEVSHLGDNVLLLEMILGDELTRTIRISKSRGRGHDGRRHSFSIRSGGLLLR